MARPGGTKTAAETASPSDAEPAPAPEILDPTALAEAILARTIRPRATDIRRLAEALLAATRKPDKTDKKKKKKQKAGKKAERKLSKIPGQKTPK